MTDRDKEPAQPPAPEPSSPPPPRAAARWRRLAVNFAVMLGGCLVALIGVEIVVRLLFYFPQPQFLRIDEHVGHRHRPGVRGYYVGEGFSKYSINSHGFRDGEYSVKKPAGVFRIALLGDSYSEALQVDLDETFQDRLERRLDKAEVLNFGVSGFGTAQEYLTWRHYARDFSPDLVLLAITSGNDVADNSKVLSGGYPRPYFALREGRLELDASFRQSRRHQMIRRFGPIYYFITDHSALAEYFDRWRRSRGTRTRRGAERKAQPLEAGLSTGIFGPPATEDLRAAWEVTERLIAELDESVRKEGARLAIVVTTSASQVDPELRKQMAAKHPDWDLDYADSRMCAFAEKRGIPCLALAPGFLEKAKETGRRYHGFGGESRGHWNAEGHRLAAELIRDFLAERKLVPEAHL